ncbi:MAG: hypothetical protein GY757_54575 [bacterium]|nr:hypothetical protein [bacterium]
MERQPLYTESEEIHGQITARLEKIAQILTGQNIPLTGGSGLMKGKTGTALFLFYYARYSAKQKYYDHAMDLISRTFDEIGENSRDYSFSRGLAGFGWAVEHLVRNGFLEADTDEILEEVDAFLLEAVESCIKLKNYTFLHGLTGLGWYFQNRAPERNINGLSAVIDGLEKTATASKKGDLQGLFWEPQLEENAVPRGYLTGMAEGCAGVVALLYRLSERGMGGEKVNTLLKGAVTHLLDIAPRDSKKGATFPARVSSPGTALPTDLIQTTLNWSLGEPGIGTALWLASTVTGHYEWQKKAMEILLHAANRKDYRSEKIMGADIACGASGLALTFNHMFLCTGREIFRESAKFWFDFTFGMGFAKKFPAGYKFWNYNEAKWDTFTGLMDGLAGIGLSLLSSISNSPPNWTDCFLMPLLTNPGLISRAPA